MNRQNIFVHLTLAVGLIILAAIVGQIHRWERPAAVQPEQKANKACAMSRSTNDRESEALVKFRRDVDFAEIKRIVARNNDLIEDEIEAVGNLVAIDDLDGRTKEQVAAEYARLTDLVEYAEPNNEIKLDPLASDENSLPQVSEEEKANQPNDPYFSTQWALHNIGQNGGKERADLSALQAWARTKGSSDVVVAVLDSGVDYKHQDLTENIWQRPASVAAYRDDELGSIDDRNGFNSADNDRDPMDDNGHGTHCAGIVGARGNNGEGITGVNWNVKIMPLKFLGRNGFGSTKDAIEAINYAIDRKRAGVNVRVISASWGSTAYSRALEDVIRKAGENGILFVAAAGNANSSTDLTPHYPSSYRLPNIISVAALDRNDALASFSNFGLRTVHLAAPGKEIMSTWIKGAYREASGTSMATPQVAGVAALVLAVDNDLSVEKLRERLLNATDKLDALNGKTVNGGKLNAAKAVGN